MGPLARGYRLAVFAPEIGDLVMRTMLAAFGADAVLPKVVGATADSANAAFPTMIGIAVNAAAPATAVFPVVIAVARMLAACAIAANPFVS